MILNIETMNDEECLKAFLGFLKERVGINTGFVRDPDTGNITHQVVQLTCGEYTSISEPEPLEVVLRPATGEEVGATIN